MCSGVLIAPRVVVTAAHCLSDTAPDQLEVLFGASLSGGSTTEAVVATRVHPAYDRTTRADDIALLELARAVSTAPLPIRSSDAVAVSSSARVVGFGAAMAGGTTGEKREGTVVITAADSTTLRYGPGPAMTCVGDSGGPVFVGNDLVAITRSGDAACDEFGVALRLDRYLSTFVNPFITQAATSSDRPPADSARRFCAETCEADRECPSAMRCLSERGAKRCGYPELQPGEFEEPCTSDVACAGRCVHVGAECRCFVACRDLPPPPPPRESGCTHGRSTADGTAWFVVVLALAARRPRRSDQR